MNQPRPVFKHSFQITVEKVSDEHSPQEYFYSVDGLEKSVVFTKQEYVPGGYSNPIETPTSHKPGKLILRRPLMETGSKITQWCEQALETLIFDPTQVYIFILDFNKNIVAQWIAENAYPTAIEISPLGLDRGSEIVEETISILYSKLVRTKPA
jgi:phage tail-like protein